MSSTAPRDPAHAAREGGPGGRVNTLPLVAPSVVLLLVFSLVPLAMTLWFSFRRYNLLNPAIHGFAGIANYKYLLLDPGLYRSLLILCCWWARC